MKALCLIIRCPICGYKFEEYFRKDDKRYYNLLDRVFSDSPCPECKPQTKIYSYITDENERAI